MGTNKSTTDLLLIKDKLIDNELFRNSNISNLNFNDLKLNFINLKKGDILFRQEDPANSIYLIIEGEINLIRKQTFGKTHSLLSKNNFFGHDEYFLETSRNSIAFALKESLVVELSKKNIEMILSHDSSILNTIKNSMQNLNPDNINNLEKAIEKFPSLLPTELVKKSNGKSSMGTSKEKQSTQESKIPANDKIDLKKVESGINRIITNINENLSLLDEEKINLQALTSVYETENKKLLYEIEKLKEQEERFVNLDKEKNEILGKQSYRIVELEKETAKLKELEAEYSKKIDLLSEQEEKNKSKLKRLETDLKEKEVLVSNLESDVKENKNAISDLNETRLNLTQKTNEQDRVIKEQSAEIKNSEKKNENLTNELTSKENSLTELNKDLQGKDQQILKLTDSLNKINTENEKLAAELSAKENNIAELNKELQNKDLQISKHTDTLNKTKAEIEKLGKELIQKDETINNLSAKVTDLQSHLGEQKEVEKNNNEYILSQSNKINEYEELLKDSHKELSKKDETIDNFIKDIGELSSNVWQKQTEINEQNSVIVELNEELNNLKKSKEDFASREAELTEESSIIKSRLEAVNNDLNVLKQDVEEKNKIIEQKESENKKLNSILSETSKRLDDANNSLETGNKKIEELESIIMQVKSEMLDSNELEKLREELNSAAAQLEAKEEIINEITREKNLLSEKIENLEQDAEESINQNNSLSKLQDELNIYKNNWGKYKTSMEEKDKIIEEQTNQFENLKLAKSAVIKTLTSTKSKYEEDTKKLEEQVEDLKRKLEEMKETLQEKIFNAEQQEVTIENQAQKIADLEILVNESKLKSVNEGVKKVESTLINNPDNNYPDVQDEEVILDENDEVLSKCKFIASESTDSFTDEKSLEHVQYSDIHILNVNISRATLDVASKFNKFLIGMINKDKNKIIVNLTNCDYIDSSILGALVSGVKKAITMEGDLRIVVRNQSEYSMFSLTKMDNIFQIFSNLKDAVNSFS
jgi:anti-anti-sigma factor